MSECSRYASEQAFITIYEQEFDDIMLALYTLEAVILSSDSSSAANLLDGLTKVINNLRKLGIEAGFLAG